MVGFMGKARFEWKDFNDKKIICSDDLENYIKYRITRDSNDMKYNENRAYFHNKFFHYTKLEFVEKILDSQSFLLSMCGNTNDPMENNIKNKESSFALCFSTGINENIPLWYLYSGVDGQGGCLTFRKPLIYELVENSTVFLDAEEKTDDKSLVDRISLERKIDFNITLQDVLYAKFNDAYNYVDIKYNNRALNKFNKDEFQKFKDNNSAFVKNIAWYYEKETRLLVELTESGKKKFDKLKSSDKCSKFKELDFKIRVSFKEITDFVNKMNLVLAPEFSVDEENNLISSEKEFEKLHKFPLIQDWIIKTSNKLNSDYTGQIKMQLCKKNEMKKEGF